MVDPNITNKPELKLYNSLTRAKEVFTPQNPKRVTMYNCGPTVYSYAHIGNARAAVVADVLFRVLRHIYGEDHVVYARNITDVDDKIIAAAKEQGVDISVNTEKFARIYNEDLAAIGCLPPTVQPKCTDHIGNMIAMISDLITKKFAYESDGHVFFDVSKYDDYGQLSGNTLENLRGGDRVGEGEVARKRNAADFVLWKPALDGVGWDAPFGNGRPGWHIECSAMAKAELTDGTNSETIDIHCGGVDLKFPHHENEIAQSSCCHEGAPLANYWVHNEFLNMGSEKMSKSLGNVKLIRDLLENWDGEVIRLALLKAHYRSELVWSEKLLEESKVNLDSFFRAYRDVKAIGIEPFLEDHMNSDVLDDLDLTSCMHNLISYSYRTRELMSYDSEVHQINQAFQIAVKAANLLGLLQKDPEEWFGEGVTDAHRKLGKEYDRLRAQAIAAKSTGDKSKMGELFSQADAIRDTLKADKVIIESSADGVSTLRRA